MNAVFALRIVFTIVAGSTPPLRGYVTREVPA